MPKPNVLYYGRPEPLPRQISLKAGPLSLIYESGDLRYICVGSTEILRRVYVAVRDANWNTLPPSISNEKFMIDEDSFQITFDEANYQNEIDFFWKGSITGERDGTITFSMRGEARSDFRRNRIGFCVLHPMVCAGLPVKIEHMDGSIDEQAFPITIAPQRIADGHPWPVAPFDNMRALSHQVAPGLWAEARFEGEVFEMEDQRNWTDASFKTYCTPLSQPFPVEIKQGTTISQSIRLSLKGQLPQLLEGVAAETVISIGSGNPNLLPKIGLGMASHGQSLDPAAIERLRALRLSHLRIDLDLSNSAYSENFRRAVEEAQSLDTSLEIALFLTDAAREELEKLRNVFDELHPPVARWLIFHKDEKTTQAKWIQMAREQLSNLAPAAPFSGGTNAYFTEINANRPAVDVLDLVTYSVNPQVHAFDNASLTETMACHAVTVASARSFAGGKPVIVSPVTLKPRYNPNATGPELEPEPGMLPSQVDVRQSSLFGLGWTVGSLKYLAESGADSVTYYETSGWRGVMEQANGAPLPQLFSSSPGGVYPMYHVFADVAEIGAGRVLRVQSSKPLLVDGLLLENDQKKVLLLANMSAQPQAVQITGLPPLGKMRRINETNLIEAIEAPEQFRNRKYQDFTTQKGSLLLELFPFETIRLDFIV